MKKNINLFLILTLFFTGVIFLINTFYFSDNLLENYEEQYLEETLESSREKKSFLEIALNILRNEEKEKIKQENIIETKEKIKQNILEKKLKKEKLNNLEKQKLIKIKEEKIKKLLEIQKYKNIEFSSVPYEFLKQNKKEKEKIETILKNKDIFSLLHKIEIIFYEEKGEVRGKMKNRTVKLFSPQTMEKDELIAIFIHEFSHYIDIYSLERSNYSDISNNFYNISWYSTKIIKSGMEQKDFVSGYSMTNKYEDFAESLTYYILHNNDFLEKSTKSQYLKEKYNFFSFYLFKNDLFKNTDFSENNIIRDYYRDITKIDFSLENFLQYLKKSI